MTTSRKWKLGLRLVDEELNCNICESHQKCLGSHLRDDQLEELRSIVHTHIPYKPGETIFKMEDTFKSIFAIRSGSVKVESALPDGINVVKGFFFPGELVGVEAIGDRQYCNDAIALELTHVCEIPFARLEQLCGSIPELQHEILVMMGHKLRSRSTEFISAHHLNAEKRVLLFIQDLSQNQHTQSTGESPTIRLPMSKTDIASYLGLRPESLSRALTKLQQNGTIRNHPKTIELLDMESIFRSVC